jgi:glycosyltransferase involved in cell wall biosynthesis
MDLISVVIPTHRRPHVIARAVRSVLRQTYRNLEVIVVIDGMDDGTRAAVNALNDDRTRVIETGRSRGPASARNFGVQYAAGKYVALLDDDDEWAPDKLKRQMQMVRRHGLEDQEFLISCRIHAVTSSKVYVWPARLYRPGDDLSEYLLDRGAPFKRCSIVASGTLLFPRMLAERVPFIEDAMHEDWSWLLLCVVRDKTPLLMCEEPMFIYHLDDASSLSKRLNWRDSFEWAQQYRPYLSGKGFAGIVSSTAAWRAKQQGDRQAFAEIAQAMPSEATLLHWLTLLGIRLTPLNLAKRLYRLSRFSEAKHAGT